MLAARVDSIPTIPIVSFAQSFEIEQQVQMVVTTITIVKEINGVLCALISETNCDFAMPLNEKSRFKIPPALSLGGCLVSSKLGRLTESGVIALELFFCSFIEKRLGFKPSNALVTLRVHY